MSEKFENKDNIEKITKEDVLDGIPYKDVSTSQRMIYQLFKKLEELEDQIKDLGKK